MTSQPQVPKEFELLEEGYAIGNIRVDLYGEMPCKYSGFNVCAIALAGTKDDLFDLVTQKQLTALSNALNAAADFEVEA